MSIDLHMLLLDEKIRRAKELCKPTDATPLLMLSLDPSLTESDRMLLSKIITDAYTHIGNVLVDRALSDGTLTEAEWKELEAKGVEVIGFSSVLQAFYAKKDGMCDPNEALIVVTGSGEPIYAIKEQLYDKFKVIVMSVEAVTDMLQKRAQKDDDVRALM